MRSGCSRPRGSSRATTRCSPRFRICPAAQVGGKPEAPDTRLGTGASPQLNDRQNALPALNETGAAALCVRNSSRSMKSWHNLNMAAGPTLPTRRQT